MTGNEVTRMNIKSQKLQNFKFFPWMSYGNMKKDDGTCVLPGINVEYFQISLSELLQGGTICETNI